MIQLQFRSSLLYSVVCEFAILYGILPVLNCSYHANYLLTSTLWVDSYTPTLQRYFKLPSKS